MHEISTIEVSILAGELNAEYSGFHIEKFYDLGNGRFRMKVRGNGRDVSLVVYLCHAVCPAQYIESADQPSQFAMAVRKRITGFVIHEVHQLGRDRILIFELHKGNLASNIILEMFGKGNLIIADQAMKITLAYVQRDFKDRSIRIGSIYSPPAQPGRREAKTIMARVSAEADVGPIYVEDAIAREGLQPGAKADEADRQVMDRIITSLSKLGGGRAFVYVRGDEIVDYSLVELKKYESIDRKEFDTLKGALAFAYGKAPEVHQENPELKRLEASIGRQRELVLSAMNEAESSREVGRLIFARMGELNQLIDAAKRNRHITVEELRSMFPHIKISDINLKDKTVTVEV